MTTIPQKDNPAVLMLPPMLVLLHVTAGITLNWIFRGYYGHAWGWIGLILLASCFVIVIWSMKLFTKAGTNVRPDQPTLAIVQEGPYKYTRNPMYLGFMLGFVGLSFLASAPFMTLLAVPLLAILDRKVIMPEETYLTEKFGDAYLDYKKKVRRWI